MEGRLLRESRTNTTKGACYGSFGYQIRYATNKKLKNSLL